MNSPLMAPRNGAQAKTLKSYLESDDVRGRLAQVASSAMKPDELVRMALLAASRQPDLAKCSQHSILRALMDAAALGVKPGGLMGRGYLVPRKNKFTKEMECCFDPGWRGLVDIARRSGRIRRIEAHVVFENDHFLVVRDPFTRIEHQPTEGDTGSIRAAYAMAEFVDGGTQIEVVMRRDLEKIRASSASENGPWATWPEEMARKSAVRRLCKYLPYDPVLERALEAATDAEAEEPMMRDADFVPDATPAKPRAKRIAERIRTKAATSNADQGEAPQTEASDEEDEHDDEDGDGEEGDPDDSS